jgi:hypothetical protein
MTEDDPDMLTSDRHIARSRSPGLFRNAVKSVVILTRFTPPTSSRAAPGTAKLIWQTAAGKLLQNWK